ncbi:MAG: hypothetical protein AMXMBFR82_21450 [Candidatus Hydrogenedentota bacterium]
MTGQASTTDQSARPHTWRVDAGLLVIALIVATALRLHKLDAGLWLDEVLTYQGANQSLGEAYLHRTQFLYYVLAHFALQVRDTEVMLRLPSVLAGLAGVVALYGLTRKAWGTAAAFLAAMLLAISPYHIDKSQEARFYAFVILANILMVWSMWNALATGRARHWIVFVLAANLGVASQFTVIPYVAALGVAGGCWLLVFANGLPWRDRSRRALHLGLACAAASLSVFTSILARGTFPFLLARGTQTDTTSAETLAYVNAYRLSPGEYLEFLHSYVPRYWTPMGYLFLALIALGAVVLAKRTPVLAFLMAAQVVLVPIPLFLVNVHHWYHERYFSCVYPFVPLLLAVASVFLADRFAQIVLRVASPKLRISTSFPVVARASIVLLFLAAYMKISYGLLLYHYTEGRAHDWRAVVEFLAPRLADGDTIAVAGPATYATQHLPKDRQVFPESHAALEYYLERTLPKGKSKTVHIVGAGSSNQIEELRSGNHSGRLYLVIESCREPERAPHSDLAKLPTRDLFQTNGLDVFQVDLSSVHGRECAHVPSPAPAQ